VRSIVLALLALAGLAATGSSQTAEDRIAALEGQIRELRMLHGLAPIPTQPVSAPVVPAPPAAPGAEHIQFGAPQMRGVFLDREFFVISHDNTRLLPEWVGYHLTEDNLEGTVQRTDDFRADPGLPTGQRSELADYRRSGFDRGHMAPAAAFRRSERAMSTTFLLSNMAPQTARLNRRIWARLERQVRSLARAHGSIWVFTGPLYLDANGDPTVPTQFIGPNRVAVPTHFYKVILCEHATGTRQMFAFMMPNSTRNIGGTPADFLVSVDQVEALAGLDYFSVLPDPEETALEDAIANVWPIN
jgi:endonuclease G